MPYVPPLQRGRFRHPKMMTPFLQFLATLRHSAVHWTCPLAMKTEASHAGLPLLIPKPIDLLWEESFKPKQHFFPVPSDIWQCVSALWQQPLKSEIPVVGLKEFFRSHGRMEMSSLPFCYQLSGSSAARKLLPPLQHDRKMHVYFIFQFVVQLASVANKIHPYNSQKLVTSTLLFQTPVFHLLSEAVLSEVLRIKAVTYAPHPSLSSLNWSGPACVCLSGFRHYCRA